MKKKDSLTPSGVKFIPINRHRREATKAKPIYGPKVARVPYVKCSIEHICLFQFIKLALCMSQLTIKASILIFSLQ